MAASREPRSLVSASCPLKLITYLPTLSLSCYNLPKPSTHPPSSPFPPSLPSRESHQSWVGDEVVTVRSGFILNNAGAYHVAPGAGAQVLHRDDAMHCPAHREGSTYTTITGCLVSHQLDRCTIHACHNRAVSLSSWAIAPTSVLGVDVRP